MVVYGIKCKDNYKTTNARVWTKNICKAANWATYREALNYLQGCYLKTIPDCKVICIEIHEIGESK